MTIRSISTTYGPQRVSSPGSSTPSAPAAAPAATSRQTSRHDSVSISDAARALAGGDASASTQAKSGLTPERVDALRKKVLEGAYNSTHVVDAVAQRLLSSGDV